MNPSLYRYLLCVDVEATCDELSMEEPTRALVVTPDKMETIELGLVVVDQQERQVVDSFQSFIRPRLHRTLTPFCKQLTTIGQRDIDAAQGFIDVMARLSVFADRYDDSAWLSWGNYDATQIRRDGHINGITSILDTMTHFNVKDWFEKVHGQRPGSLKSCVERLGIEWVGTYHRGIDDARNVAAIVLHLLEGSAR